MRRNDLPPQGFAVRVDLTQHCFDKLVGAAIARRPRNEFFRNWAGSDERPKAIGPQAIIPIQLVEELIKEFSRPDDMVEVALMAGLPRHHLTGTEDAREFWERSARQVASGMNRNRR